MKFFTDEVEFVFENPSQYPSRSPVEMMQVSDRTAAGTLRVETYAKPIKKRVLNFIDMSLYDYQGLLNFYLNVVNGMEIKFSFEDERESIFSVSFQDRIINFQETSFNRFSGSITLEIY